MIKVTTMKKIMIALAALLCAASFASAQDMAVATETYNNGVMALQGGDKATALNYFNEAMSLGQACGDEGAELVANCKNAIPGIILSIAKGQINDGAYDDAVKTLDEAGIVPICVGGGGIPVIVNDEGNLEGVAAVIDKDLGSELLAEELDSDALVILTAVPKVYINYNKPDQKALDHLTIEEAEKYMEEGHFASGSMLPKIEAVLKFAKSKPGRVAIITSLDKAVDALAGNDGTWIG